MCLLTKIIVIVFLVSVVSGCAMNDYNKQPDTTSNRIIEEPYDLNFTEPSQPREELIPTYIRITADETQRMMSELTDYILLDVRTDEEFKESRIDGAILIPDYELASRAETELPNKDMFIFIYCRSGRRSANAAQELIAMGYTNVYDFGGIIDWHYETVSG